MKVLLVSPSFYKNVYKPISKPPLGIAYIASSLEKDGHIVRILDMYSFGLDKDDLLRNVKDFKPDVVGFSVLTPFMESVGAYSKMIKEYDPNVRIVVGGVHPSSFPEKILREYSSCDIAVFGEGELTMRELLNNLENGEKLRKIQGIAYREDSEIILNDLRPLIKDLDEIPFPAWHLMNMDAYLTDYEYRWEDRYSPRNHFMILTSRGCPGRCTFCDSHQIWKRKLRYRRPENIMKELRILKNDYGVEYFIINDDTFTVKKSRVMEFCDNLIEENLNLKWECKARVNFIDEERLKKMKLAGCELICYGAESGSQEVLDFVKKGITTDQIKEAREMTRDAKIKTHFFWMMGFPIETKQHVLETMKLAIELKSDNCGLPHVLVPYPSTDIYEYMVSNDLILEEDYDKFWKVHEEQNNATTPIKTHYLNNSELMELKRYVDREIKKDFYKRMIFKYSIRPHLLIAFFIKDPKFISHYIKDSLRTFVS